MAGRIGYRTPRRQAPEMEATVRFTPAFGFAIPILVLALIAYAYTSAFAHMSTPSTNGLRSLSDAELRLYLGADGGPGEPSPRDCFVSAASCSPIMPCPPQGAYVCTTCVTGPTSMICRDAQTSGCTTTGMINCPSAGRGTCFNGACAVTVAQECGLYYTCP